jgi:hypothetical protein
MPIGYMSDYGPAILQFIQQNEPCTRKDVLKEFNTVAPKTVYVNVTKLLNQKKIHQGEFGLLGTIAFDAPVWTLPSIMQNFTNFSPIANAFAKDNPAFKKMVEEVTKNPRRVAVLMCDLIVIANSANSVSDDLRKQFKHTKKVDVHALEQYMTKLSELVNQYSEGDITTEGE